MVLVGPKWFPIAVDRVPLEHLVAVGVIVHMRLLQLVCGWGGQVRLHSGAGADFGVSTVPRCRARSLSACRS